MTKIQENEEYSLLKLVTVAVGELRLHLTSLMVMFLHTVMHFIRHVPLNNETSGDNVSLSFIAEPSCLKII